ncbi:hypothetical protein FAK_09450 [Desulfoferula mesophila]|uniref:Transposase n=1 Tax=Desulfoferula mesophila TaxID=3058419 RepID=A0AAU9EH24_9BACT|nr:hypothetical protein FAK_09450 [Desulfoferula mesophilus]
MGRKRYSAEQMIGKLREAEILLAKGQLVGNFQSARWVRLRLMLTLRLREINRGKLKACPY